MEDHWDLALLMNKGPYNPVIYLKLTSASCKCPLKLESVIPGPEQRSEDYTDCNFKVEVIYTSLSVTSQVEDSGDLSGMAWLLGIGFGFDLLKSTHI